MLKIGQTTVYVDEFRGFIESLPELRKVEITRYPERMSQLVAEFVESIAVLEYARQRGYLERPEVKIRMLLNMAELVRPYIFSSEVRPHMQVDFREIQDFYEKNKEMFRHPEVVRVMKISSDDVEKLKRLRREFKSIKDFVEYAQHNLNPLDFDLGYISRENNLPKEISDLIFSMKAGEISQPVRFGNEYAIFAVLDKLEEGYWSLEQSIEKIFRTLREQKIRERIRQMTKDFIMTTDIYVNFDGIQREFNVSLSRERFEELFMERFSVK